MTDQWFAIVEKGTGFLLSTGTVIDTRTLPSYVDIHVLANAPKKNEFWSAKDLKFIPRAITEAPPSLLSRIVDDTRLDNLTIEQKGALRAVLQSFGVAA